jgi:hypothetical protein
MRVRQQIPNPWGADDDWDDRVRCGWSDCENPGSGLHAGVECFAARGIRRHSELPRRPECAECRRIAFCSAQHMDMYFRSHRPGQFGRLSAGVNGRYL